MGGVTEGGGTIASVPDTIIDPAAGHGEEGASGLLPQPPTRRGIDTGGRSLRAFAARGVVLNAGFDIGLSLLGLVQGFLLAVLLTRAAYGVWGILVVSLGVLAQLKVVGISDKYLQQEEADQELAFQRAFTLELMLTAAAMVVLVVALPVVAVVYGHWELIAPGAVVISVLAADALQAPFWIAYRAMNFARQRALSAVEPVVAFVVTIVLAAAGLGYWALALGLVAGAWVGAAVAILTSPFRLRWRYDRGTLSGYVSFSGPILVATLCTVLLANGTMIAANARLGLAGAGAVALASKITEFTTRLDALLSGTLYPAICAMQHRVDLLRESFVKSNRLALMWAMPFGVGLALFAGDLVHFAIGEKWRPAVGLLQVMGIVAAINHVGFNWDDYFRVRADTRPLGVTAVASTAALLGVGIPLLAVDGLDGLAVGIAASGAVALVVRAWYVVRLFEGFRFLPHALRAALPTVPAAAVVALERVAVGGGPRPASLAVLTLVSYVLVAAGATWLIERALLTEAIGYLRSRGA